MATYTVTHKQVTDNVAVVQLLEPLEFEVGQSITLAGIGAGWNATHKILALPEYYFTGVSTQGDYEYDTSRIIPNQVLFALTTDVMPARDRPIQAHRRRLLYVLVVLLFNSLPVLEFPLPRV